MLGCSVMSVMIRVPVAPRELVIVTVLDTVTSLLATLALFLALGRNLSLAERTSQKPHHVGQFTSAHTKSRPALTFTTFSVCLSCLLYTSDAADES